MFLSVCFVLVALITVTIGQTDIEKCTYTATDGKVFDLSPLISSSGKGYVWSQTVWDTENNLFTNDDYSDQQNFTLQLQLCRNITLPMNAVCEAATPAPVYLYNPTTKKCNALGSLIAEFFPNPFNDGVYLDYFGGDSVDHIVHYETHVYFVCKPDVTMTGPLLEHIKESSQVHIRINTKYAC